MAALTFEDVVAPKFLRIAHWTAPLAEEVRKRGFAIVPGFLREDAVDAFVSDLRGRMHLKSSAGLVHTNPYYEDTDPSLPVDHARNLLVSKSNSYIMKSALPPATNILAALRDTPTFREFLQTVMRTSLVPYGSVESSEVVAISLPGDHQGWHFDHNLLTITLMLQPSSSGGILEVHSKLRDDEHENFEVVASAVGGNLGRDPERVVFQKGTMCVFPGRHSLHRVTEVTGSVPRIQGILSFDNFHGRVPKAKHFSDVYGKARL